VNHHSVAVSFDVRSLPARGKVFLQAKIYCDAQVSHQRIKGGIGAVAYVYVYAVGPVRYVAFLLVQPEVQPYSPGGANVLTQLIYLFPGPS